MESQGTAEPVAGRQVFTLRKMPKPQMELNVRFDLFEKPKSRCYTVKISAEIPLEGAWISCNVPIHFLVPKATSYEMTRTESQAEQRLGNKFSATLRFKPNCTSAEFSYRAVDGQRGSLVIFVSAVNNTGRCTQREVIRIAPLSSYRRLAAVDENRDYNILQIKGNFSSLKAQAWVENCFQDIGNVGYKLEDSEGTFAFESMVLETHMQCSIKFRLACPKAVEHLDLYQGRRNGKLTGIQTVPALLWDQELVFRCENPSTLAILMQILTRQATGEKIKLDIRPKVLPEACTATLVRIDRLLAPISGRNNIRNLQDAVAEISAAEGGESSLHPMFRSEGWKKLQGKDDAFDTDNQMSADFLHALVIDLMRDYAKLRGKSVTQRLPDLVNVLLRDYSLRNLQSFAASV